MASMYYVDSGLSDITNTIVHFDQEGDNLSLRLQERSPYLCDVG